MDNSKRYIAPAEESAPFRMGKTPFDPATGKYLPLVPELPLIQELTITGECEDGDNADDCLVCEDKYGTTLYVAKPFMLQRTPFDGLLIDSIVYEYTTPHERIADDLTTAESQEITPAYIFDGSEKIMAARVYQHAMRVGPRQVHWIDLNTAGRDWMRLKQDMVIPSGLIAEFEGYGDDIPAGWTLCDGGLDSKGETTPDMGGRFVAGYDSGRADYDEIGTTGGFKLHGPAENEHAKFRTYPTTSGTNNYAYWDRNQASPCSSVDTDNRPPYYVLAFIRKD